jgi:peptidoglycan/LPS O-acetylase OafA/YrhL
MPRGRVPGLDALRVLSTAMVIAFHVVNVAQRRSDQEGAGRLILGGYAGVDIFFVISGIVISLPVVTQGRLGPWRHYYARRAARILPLYLVVVVVGSALHGTAVVNPSGPAPFSGSGWRELLVNTFFLQTPVYGWDFARTGLGFDPVIWTLSIEMLFYILLPLFITRYLRRPVLWTVGAIAVGRLWVGWTGTLPTSARSLSQVQLPTYFGQFALGIGLAVLLKRIYESGRAPALERAAPMLVLIGVTGLLAYEELIGPMARTGDVRYHLDRAPMLMAIIAILALGMIFARGLLGRILASGPVLSLADATYGIYLLHVPFIVAAYEYLPLDSGSWGDRGLLLVAGLCSIPPALMLSRWFEKPIRAAVARRLRREVLEVVEPVVTVPGLGVTAEPIAQLTV